MTFLQVVIDNPETIQKQIKQLRDLVIEYHFAVDSWTKTWIPIIVSLAVVGVSIFGQYLIFRLNKTKEIKLRVAELYGKFHSKTLQYRLTIWKCNFSIVHYVRNQYLYSHYDKLCRIEEQRPDDEDFEKRDNYHKLLTDSNKTYSSDWEIYKNQKIELLEILHQIHFYYNDAKLDGFIKKVRKFDTLEIKITEYNLDLENEKFFDMLYKSKLKENYDGFKSIFEEISELLLKLS